MHFHEYTFQVRDRRVVHAEQESTRLLREGVSMFLQLLESYGLYFTQPLPAANCRHLELQWSSEHPSAGLATFWANGQPMLVGLYMSGSSEKSDQHALAKFCEASETLYKMGPSELGLDVRYVTQRPVAVYLPLLTDKANPSDFLIVQELLTCLAGAFFERSRDCLWEEMTEEKS